MDNTNTDIGSPHTVAELFRSLPTNQLYLEEPRQNCTARAQLIVDWLNAHKLIAGRIWVLPAAGEKSFSVPLKDKYGKALDYPAPYEDTTSGNAGLQWICHVAATVETTEGTVVLDPALFEGPVTTEVWKNLFSQSLTEFKKTKYYEAPLYGAFGSCYLPGLQEDHIIDDRSRAFQEFAALKILMADPAYRQPNFERLGAEPIRGNLLQKTKPLKAGSPSV